MELDLLKLKNELSKKNTRMEEIQSPISTLMK